MAAAATPGRAACEAVQKVAAPLASLRPSAASIFLAEAHESTRNGTIGNHAAAAVVAFGLPRGGNLAQGRRLGLGLSSWRPRCVFLLVHLLNERAARLTWPSGSLVGIGL